MSFLERLGFGQPNETEEEPKGSIKDVNDLLILAERNDSVQTILDTFEENMEEISNNVMMGGGSTTPGDRALVIRFAATAAKDLKELGYEVSPEIISQTH
jgi:hypothetical protein